MRFASPSPPPTPANFHRSVSFTPAPSTVPQPRASTSKAAAAAARPTGRFGLDLRKREWDASSDEAASSDDDDGDDDSTDDEGAGDSGILARLAGSSSSSRPSRPREGPSVLRGVAYVDEIESYDLQSRSLAWRKSHRAALVHSAHLASLLSPGAHRPQRRAASEVDAELGEVRRLLEGMRVERAEEERRERGAFEQRNKKLWDDIEATIQTSEQEHLQAARLKQAEADRKAAAARQAAEAEEAARVKAAADAKAAEAAAKRKEEEAVRRSEEKAQRAAEQAKRREAGGGLEVKADEFGRWVDRMRVIKTEILPKVNGSPEWKKKCNAVKRQVTPKVGQITNDRQAILRITSELSLILHSALAASPEIYTWILNHLAKILIKQAEAEVTANPAAAWPLARLVVGLVLMGHGEGLGDVLMARLVKKCCWVVPFSPAKQPDQTDAEHRKLLGHLANTPESTLEYTNRLTGILTLYTSILCVLPSPALLPPRPPGHPPYPTFSPTLVPPQFRLSAGWSWLAAILRPPMAQLEPTPTLVAAFLDVAAPRLLALYAAQAKKALMAVGKDVLGPAPTLGGGKNKPGLARLGLRLEEWQRAGFGPWKEMEGSELLT